MKRDNDFSIRLAGLTLKYGFLDDTTPQYFRKFIDLGADTKCGTDEMLKKRISISREELDRHKRRYEKSDPAHYIEYCELQPKTSDFLLNFGRCIFHCTAFCWNGKAYAFTAPSGTGKTTQYVLWKMLYGDDIRILNGDKPVMEVKTNGEIWLHPSPWNGKEGMGRMESAPLGGLIYLEQGEENKIARMTARDAILPLYSQFLFSRDTEEEIERVFAMLETVINRVPVWNLKNRGDIDSARICHDAILQSEVEGGRI